MEYITEKSMNLGKNKISKADNIFIFKKYWEFSVILYISYIANMNRKNKEKENINKDDIDIIRPG